MKNIIKNIGTSVLVISLCICFTIITQATPVKKSNKSPLLVNPKYTVMNQKAKVTVNATDSKAKIKSVTYVKGTVTNVNSALWTSTGKKVSNLTNFTVAEDGEYSILVKDSAGNKVAKTIRVSLELRAVWISFCEFSAKKYSQTAFQEMIDNMFDNCADWNMNAVIVQVRPFSDALYKSSYFPWSEYGSGIQGKDPGYDPLQIMVNSAHKRGLQIHAWVNPYRITNSGTDVSVLSPDNPARKWSESTSKSLNRNVLSFGGKLYFNPSKSEVRSLIVNGVKEIVKNYDVDGIHFDDYFYPSLDAKKYTSTFDAVEYNEYASKCNENGIAAKDIVSWRRNNVSTLVKNVYSSIKKIDKSVQFGISPSGNIDNLLAKNKYYVDIETWLGSSSYVDYICPQIYWSFLNKTCPFDTTVDRWLSIRTSKTVNVYIGIPLYKAGSDAESEFEDSTDIIKRMVEYTYDTGLVDGCFYYRYDYFNKKATEDEVNNLLSILN